MAMHVPTSHFGVHIELPEKMCAGDKISMLIEVSHDFSRTTALVIPTIFLKRFHITLETHPSTSTCWLSSFRTRAARQLERDLYRGRRWGSTLATVSEDRCA
ncbi:hypothetical protein ABVK25_003937 [Lepraria finkii]|uniref:Uncharacterized protein n=1 Tax=Lepraria finkii TaxID=1340010 RepID=A0ABR4BCX3_9LECA